MFSRKYALRRAVWLKTPEEASDAVGKIKSCDAIGNTPSCFVRSPPRNKNALSLITAPPAPNPYCCRLYFGLPDGNPANPATRSRDRKSTRLNSSHLGI